MKDMKPVYAYVPREDHKLLDEIHKATGVNKSDFVYLMIHLAYGMGPKFLEEVSDVMMLSGPAEVQNLGRKLIENSLIGCSARENEYI